MADVKYIRRVLSGEKGSASYASSQPKLFDDSGYVRPTSRKTGVQIYFEPLKPSQIQDYSAGEQLRFYMEYPSSEAHLKQAFRENIRKKDDPFVVERLDAGRKARAELESGNYTGLLSALSGYKNGSGQKVTEEDFQGSTHYTSPESVAKFKKEYGLEPSAVGLVIPKEKWKGTSPATRYSRITAPDGSTRAEFKPIEAKEGLAKKTGRPEWSAGTSLPSAALHGGPYDKSGVTFISEERVGTGGGEHELVHSAYHTRSNHPSHYVRPKGEDELFLTTELEGALVNELSAYRVQVGGAMKWAETKARMTGIDIPPEKLSAARRSRWEKTGTVLKEKYIPNYEKVYAKAGYDQSRIHEMLERSGKKLDKALDAISYMEDSGVSERAISHMLIAVGQTKSELSDGEFHSPLDDVAAWGNYVKSRAERRQARKTEHTGSE